MIFLTLSKLHRFYINNMISSFGWNSAMVPIFVSNLFYVLLLCSVFFKDLKEKSLFYHLKDKAVFLFSGILIFLATITSVYLIYQKSPIITGVQGRYLFPLIPMFFILFSSYKYNLQNKIIPILVIGFMQILLFISVLTLILRFY